MRGLLASVCPPLSMGADKGIGAHSASQVVAERKPCSEPHGVLPGVHKGETWPTAAASPPYGGVPGPPA